MFCDFNDIIAVDEWRSQWHLNMRFDDATPDDLINDMEDIHPHVRIKAISTCARASAYKPPPLEGKICNTLQIHHTCTCLIYFNSRNYGILYT